MAPPLSALSMLASCKRRVREWLENDSSVPGYSGVHIIVEKYCKVQSLLQSNSEELIYDCLPPLTLASLLCYCSVVFGENSIYCTSHYPETFFSSLQAGHGPSIVRPVHASILQEAFERMVGKCQQCSRFVWGAHHC